MSIPIVKVEKISLSDNYYSTKGYTYDCSTIIQFCKEKNYPIFDLPLAGINLDVNPWTLDNIKSITNHFKRIQDVDLNYPVILDSTGYICDGWHRVVKALTLELTTIKAIRMEEMPPYSGKIEEKTI